MTYLLLQYQYSGELAGEETSSMNIDHLDQRFNNPVFSWSICSRYCGQQMTWQEDPHSYLPLSVKTLLINYWRNQMWLRILLNTALQAATDSLQSRWMSLKRSFIFKCGDQGYIFPWLQDLSTKQCTAPNQHPGCYSFPRTNCWTRSMYSFGGDTSSSFNIYNPMNLLISFSVTSDNHG